MVFNFGHQFYFADIKQFLLAHGLNIFKWVVAGGKFPKNEVEQQQLMYFKNKVFTIRHWMTNPTMYRYCTKEDDGLTERAYCSCTAGYEIYACFF